MKLPYESVCPTVGRVIGPSIGWLVPLSQFPKRGREFTSQAPIGAPVFPAILLLENIGIFTEKYKNFRF